MDHLIKENKIEGKVSSYTSVVRSKFNQDFINECYSSKFGFIFTDQEKITLFHPKYFIKFTTGHIRHLTQAKSVSNVILSLYLPGDRQKVNIHIMNVMKKLTHSPAR